MARITRHEDFSVVEVDLDYDELDEATLARFREQLVREAATANPPLVIVDLSRASFIGSSFIAVLIEAWKALRQRQGKLGLCGMNDVCAEAIHVARLDTVWQTYRNLDEARQTMAAPAGELPPSATV